MVQMRHHFPRAAVAGQPAEIMFGSVSLKLLSVVSAPKPLAATLPGRAAGVAGGQAVAALRQAIGELHVDSRSYCGSPNGCRRFRPSGRRSVMLARRQGGGGHGSCAPSGGDAAVAGMASMACTTESFTVTGFSAASLSRLR